MRSHRKPIMTLLLALCLLLCACSDNNAQSGEGAKWPQFGLSGQAGATASPTKKESKLLHKITEDKYGTVTHWVDRYYDGDRLLTEEDVITGLTTSYDEQGRERTVTTGMGVVVEEWRYDEAGNLIYYMPQGSTTITLYDHQGNEIYRSAQAGGLAEEYEYDALGRVVSSRFVTEEYGGLEISLSYAYSPDGPPSNGPAEQKWEKRRKSGRAGR